MAVILEKTNSAYYSCFRNLFKNIVVALAEAKDICLYLKPLQKHISLLEETDFSESMPLLAPLMHVVCLVWANSKYYDQVKLIVLLKQICNLLIHEVFNFFYSELMRLQSFKHYTERAFLDFLTSSLCLHDS